MLPSADATACVPGRAVRITERTRCDVMRSLLSSALLATVVVSSAHTAQAEVVTVIGPATP